MSDKPNERRHRPQRTQRDTYTAYDRAMIRAKEDNRTVEFIMATGSVVEGHICSVDKYFIEIDDTYSNNRGGLIWLNKAAIESARIQKPS